MKKHNSLSVEYDELEHLKNNMNEYLGRDKTEKRNKLLKPSIENRLGKRLKQKRLQELIEKIQKKLIYKADSYLVLFPNIIAYDIMYDI